MTDLSTMRNAMSNRSWVGLWPVSIETAHGHKGERDREEVIWSESVADLNFSEITDSFCGFYADTKKPIQMIGLSV